MWHEVSNLCLFATPLNDAAAHNDPLEQARVFSIDKRQAQVDKLREQLVKSDMLNLEVLALAILQDSKEDSTKLLKNSLSAFSILIVRLLFVNLQELSWR